MLDSHLMPLPTPESADKVEANITINNVRIIANVVGDPSLFIIHSAPVILKTPEAN